MEITRKMFDEEGHQDQDIYVGRRIDTSSGAIIELPR